MAQHVHAIFDHGVLKPLGPVDLQDQQVVSLSIEKLPEAESDAKETDPTFFDLLDEAGLIGCIKDGPADLSTNPKHMEGFGKSER
jgi:predicted DNA-binding antitoxin AbrB/MazE fold protein